MHEIAGIALLGIAAVLRRFVILGVHDILDKNLAA
jgi:hypothetical protein